MWKRRISQDQWSNSYGSPINNSRDMVLQSLSSNFLPREILQQPRKIFHLLIFPHLTSSGTDRCESSDGRLHRIRFFLVLEISKFSEVSSSSPTDIWMIEIFFSFSFWNPIVIRKRKRIYDQWFNSLQYHMTISLRYGHSKFWSLFPWDKVPQTLTKIFELLSLTDLMSFDRWIRIERWRAAFDSIMLGFRDKKIFSASSLWNFCLLRPSLQKLSQFFRNFHCFEITCHLTEKDITWSIIQLTQLYSAHFSSYVFSKFSL